MFYNLKIVLKLSFRSVFNNWARNKIIIAIIAVSFILLEFLLSLSAGFGMQVKNFVLDSLIGHIKIMNPQYKIETDPKYNFYLDEKILQEIEGIEGIKGITKRIQIPVVLKSERKIKNGMLVGIDTKTEKDLSFIGKDYPYKNFDNIFQDEGILIGKELVEKLETKINYKIVASAQDANDKLVEKAFFMKDIFTTGIPNAEGMFIFTDIKTVAGAYGLLKQGDIYYTEVSIILENDDNTLAIMQEVKNKLPKNINIETYSWGDIMPFLKGWLDMMETIIWIFFIIALFAAAIPISNTLLISVLERVSEFGLMQALGMKKFYLFCFIIFEAIIIVVIGLIIGLILGLLNSYIFQIVGIDISGFSQGASKLGLGDTIYPLIVIKNTISVALVMLLSGILASIYPAIKASLYNPVQALSKRG